VSDEAPDDDHQGHIARTLTELIMAKSPSVRSDGKRMSDQQVAKAVNDHAGRKVISHTYVWQLRTGRRKLREDQTWRGPTWAVFEALASYFDVSPQVFLTDPQREYRDGEQWLLARLREAGVLKLAFRAEGLSAEALKLAIEFVDHARKLEGLGEPRAAPDGVERRVSSTGAVFVESARSGQRLDLGRQHAGERVTLYIDDEHVRVELPDGTHRTFIRREGDRRPSKP
jgi:ESX-1-secreted protein regulator